MSLEAGHKLAHYEIVAPIGKGGMGEVYQATDKKLGRDVAIKVLPEAFAQDEERLRRFQREAKVLASLNHPNIAAIYGLEQSGTTHYLVLELVPGETLAERIARGPIPLDEALDIAIKIAEALEEAHAHGVVHRDLKPTNIKLTPDGKVKVLDFGLAKAFAEEAPDVDDDSMSPTITRDATRIGVILGTAGYMSPEQAKGKTVDKRTDNFAFGVVLYEMLSSKKAFPGDDVSEVLAAVIKLEPDWSALPASLPPRVRRVLRRCLEKDARQRCRDIADARIELEDDRVDAPEQAPSKASKPRWLTAVSLAVLAFVIGWLWPQGGASIGVERFTVPLDPALRIENSVLTFSPVSRELVFSALSGNEWQLYRRSRGELEAIPIPGSEGAVGAFFSPKGDWLGFYTATGELKKMSWPSPGAPLIVSETAGGFGARASWSDDDTIVFTAGDQVMRVPAAGGVATPITTQIEDGTLQIEPQLLPNGRWILFTLGRGAGGREIAVASSETGKWRTLENGAQPRYVSTGHLLYVSEGALWARGFDPNEGRVLGNAVRMVNSVSRFDVGHDGTLAYVDRISLERQRLVWVSRSGVETPALEKSESFRKPRLSTDGRRLAVDITEAISRNTDLWVYDLGRGTRTRLTFEGNNTDAVWTPDGSLIAHSYGPGNGSDIVQRRSDGTGDPETLVGAELSEFPSSWSPDGRVLAFYQRRANFLGAGRDIWTLRVDDGSEPRPFLQTPFNERSPSFSPNGSWLAYTSDESGEDQIYIQAFPGPSAKITVSRHGGHEPVWSRDGRELFFRSGGEVWSAAIAHGSSLNGLDVSEPALLFDGPFAASTDGDGSQTYDVAPDGRFLMVKPDESSSSRLVVVLSWVEELKRLVPSKP